MCSVQPLAAAYQNGSFWAVRARESGAGEWTFTTDMEELATQGACNRIEDQCSDSTTCFTPVTSGASLRS